MKLDYEVYKLLTPEEKEEFDYKFEEKLDPMSKLSYLIITILKVSSFMLAFIMLFSTFIVTIKTNIGTKITGDTILMIMKLLDVWLFLTFILFLFSFLYFIVDLWFSSYKLKNFINNILYKEVVDGKDLYKRKDEKQQEE